MKKSPLQRAGGGGLADWLNYADIAKAGKPQNLTGEAIVQLGALFTQVFPDDLIDFGKAPEVKADARVPDSKEELSKKLTDNIKTGGLDPEANLFPSRAHVALNPKSRGVFEPSKDTGVTEEITPPIPTPPEQKEYVRKYADYEPQFGLKQVEQFMASNEYKNMGQLGKQKINRSLEAIRRKGKNVNSPNIFRGVGMPEEFFDYMRMPVPSKSGKGSGDATYNTQTELYKQPGKDVGVLEQLRTGNFSQDQNGVGILEQFRRKAFGFPRLDNNTLEILKKLSYARKNDDDSPLFRVAHVASSPFTKTDMVGYRYMKRAVMPEYAQGSLGSAAAEGFNLAIDKYNYNQAVKEDFDNLLEEETKGLDIDVDFTGADFQKDYLNTAQGIKKEVAQAVAQYAQGKITKMDLEAIKTKSLARVKSLAGAGQQLKTLRTDYVDKIEKGLIDPGASNGEHTDLFNTLYKAPDNLTVKTINGIDYVVGKTLQGNDLKVAVSKLADGTTGLGVMPKADLSSLVTLAGTKIGAATKEGKTALGMGTIGASLEDAERISKEVFEAKLRSDETFLRSAVSQIAGLDYDEYEAATAGPEKQAEKAALIEDTAQAMFQQYIKPGYTQTSQTKYRDTPKTGGTTAGERGIAVIKSKLDNLPPPTSGNVDNYMTLLKLNKGEAYQVKGNKLIIGDVKAGTALRTIDLSNPTLAKSQIANLAGVLGYGQGGQPQDLSLYNFDL